MRSLLIALLCLPLCAADQVVPPKLPANAVRMPAASSAPAAVPVTPQKLTSDLLFFIDSDIPLLVLSSPAGMVNIVKETGTLRARGRFIDNPTKTVTKVFNGKFIYQIEAAKTGLCELLVIPSIDDEKKVIRRTLDVDAGEGPRPPPIPPGPIPPSPVPPTPVPVTSFRVIFAYESGTTLTAAQSGVLNGKAVEEYLRANTTPENNVAGFRRFDKDTDASKDQPTMAALWAAVKPKITAVPCMVVEVNGKADILPFPTSPADALATLKKYNGGK